MTCLQVRAAEEELASLKQAADARASEARGAERARSAAQADKALLAAQLATQRRKAAVAAEAADTAAIEQGLLQRVLPDWTPLTKFGDRIMAIATPEGFRAKRHLWCRLTPGG